MGSTTALYLARGGMKVSLIDRGSIAREASGVNAGTLTMHMTRADLIPYAMRGWEMWRDADQWLGLKSGITTTDGLCLAFTEEEADMLRQRSEVRRAAGAPIRIIDRSEARRIEPSLTEKVRLAAHCPIDGHVSAYLTGMAYRRALISDGVNIMERAGVTGIDDLGYGYQINTLAGTIQARRIVLAGGAWLGQMLSWLGINIRIRSLVNQLIVTERLPVTMRTVITVASGLLSLKQFANGTTLIGGGWQGAGGPERNTMSIIPENMIGNTRLAAYAIPALKKTRVVRAWLGPEAETDDAMPIIGPVPGRPGAFVIGSVHSGYTSGPYMGRLMADFILGRESEHPLFPVDRLIKNTLEA